LSWLKKELKGSFFVKTDFSTVQKRQKIV
jgi:hypothetical protein